VGRRTPKAVRVVEKLAAAVDRRSLREMQNLLFKIRGNTSLPTNVTSKSTGSTLMPIESPSPIGSKTHSDFRNSGVRVKAAGIVAVGLAADDAAFEDGVAPRPGVRFQDKRAA
jgi:hypothetical protein